MNKNVSDQEAHIRTGGAVLLILIALYLLSDHSVISIILALIAAVLAATAYMRTCPIQHMVQTHSSSTDAQETTPVAHDEEPTPPAQSSQERE